MKLEQVKHFAEQLYEKGYTEAAWHMSRDDLREVSRYTQSIGRHVAMYLSEQLEISMIHWDQEERDEKEN